VATSSAATRAAGAYLATAGTDSTAVAAGTRLGADVPRPLEARRR
jgi:hypothetical protein